LSKAALIVEFYRCDFPPQCSDNIGSVTFLGYTAVALENVMKASVADGEAVLCSDIPINIVDSKLKKRMETSPTFSVELKKWSCESYVKSLRSCMRAKAVLSFSFLPFQIAAITTVVH